MDNNFKNGFIKYGLDNGYIKPPKKEKKLVMEWENKKLNYKNKNLKN